MPKLKFKISAFHAKVKKDIKKNPLLMANLSTLLNSTHQGVCRMLDDDSQTLFHFKVLEIIKEFLKVDDIEELCKSKV